MAEREETDPNTSLLAAGRVGNIPALRAALAQGATDFRGALAAAQQSSQYMAVACEIANHIADQVESQGGPVLPRCRANPPADK